MSDTPILDLLMDRQKLRDRVVDAARKEVRHHVVDQALSNIVMPRVDEIVGRARRR